MLGLSQCPLCQLECGSREQLIAHVYQVGVGSKWGDVSGLKLLSCPKFRNRPGQGARDGFVLIFAVTELN